MLNIDITRESMMRYEMIIVYQMHRRTLRRMGFHEKLRGCLTEVSYLVLYRFSHYRVGYGVQVYAALVR